MMRVPAGGAPDLSRAVHATALRPSPNQLDDRGGATMLRRRMSTTYEYNSAGFRVCGLRSRQAQVEIIPELGARIVSLRTAGGREWMWSPAPTFRAFRVATGTPFAQGPLCGADECIPTIAACVWRGRPLPDHGEAWTESWSVDEAAFAAGRLKTSVTLPYSPLRIERTVSLAGARVELQYTLINVGREPCEYLWALHPLLRIEPGDRLVLPPEVRRVRTEGAFNCPLGERGHEWDWSAPPGPVRTAELDLGAANAAVKLFTPPLTEAWARIENVRTGESVRFEFDSVPNRTLGVWINRGGWEGHHHVALEPTNGAPDALDVAVESWRRYSQLLPGATQAWSVAITLGAPPEAT